MKAGQMNRQITIQSPSQTIDAYGGPVFSWSDVATVWAKVHPLRGRELIAAQAAQNETTVKFYIRYRPGITSAKRVLYDGKIYDIIAVIDVNEAHVDIEITAKTGVTTG